VSSVDPSTSSRSPSRSKGAICYEHTRDGETERVRVAQNLYPDEFAIRDIGSDGREYADALPDLSLPGAGELLDDCGEDVPALVCSERGCGSVYEVGRTCRRSRCPRCWKSWAFQRSKTVASKLEALRRYHSANGDEKYLHHVTASLPDSTRFDSEDPLDRAIDLTKSLAHQVNISTGYIVYHPYRIAAEHRGEVNGHDSGEGDMTWADVLSLVETEGEDAVREEYLIHSPHFHVLCLSEFVQGGEVSKRIEEKTGAVSERITEGEDSSVSIYDLEDLCSVTAYAHSHAGLSRDEDGETWRAVVRPFGEVANFTPTSSVERDVDRTLREVAPTVLGVEFPKPECSEQRLDEDAPDPPEDGPAAGVDRPAARFLTPSEGSDSGSGSTSPAGPADLSAAASMNTGYADESDTWDVPASAVPPSLYEPDEDLTSPCGGTLVPMWAAEERLNDDEWMASLPSDAATKLREAHARWQALGQLRPDTPPPD